MSCRKLRTGHVPFSKELSAQGAKVRLWNMVVKCKEGRKINRAIIKRLARKYAIPTPLSCTLAQAVENLRDALRANKQN